MADNEISGHPVPMDMRASLSEIKLTHIVLPLAVYDVDGNYVEPENVVGKLKNSLIEVHYELKHWGMRENNVVTSDIFSGIIQQIVILKAAPEAVENVYRKSLRNGPVKIEPDLDPVDLSGGFRVPTAENGGHRECLSFQNKIMDILAKR